MPGQRYESSRVEPARWLREPNRQSGAFSIGFSEFVRALLSGPRGNRLFLNLDTSFFHNRARPPHLDAVVRKVAFERLDHRAAFIREFLFENERLAVVLPTGAKEIENERAIGALAVSLLLRRPFFSLAAVVAAGIGITRAASVLMVDCSLPPDRPHFQPALHPASRPGSASTNNPRSTTHSGSVRSGPH